MYRSILVPIDISETDLTRHVVPQVWRMPKPLRSTFQPLFLPFRSMPRWGWLTQQNSRTEAVCRPRPAKNSKRLLSSSIFLQAGVRLTSFTARRRIRSSNWRKRQTLSLLLLPHISWFQHLSAGFNGGCRSTPCKMSRAGCAVIGSKWGEFALTFIG